MYLVTTAILFLAQTPPPVVLPPQPAPPVVVAPAIPAPPALYHDGLGEVNAERAKRGLKPFIRDDGLSIAAGRASAYRAAHLVRGHTASDFQFLPPGVSSPTNGCGALTPWWGWGTCCTYDRYTYAGAAWVMGRDGRRYMHLFVR